MNVGREGLVVALAGGVGGARMVDGLDRALPEGALCAIVNTGDDFEHWGLHISPDLDTVVYTLAGFAPEERGWGIEGDTFHALDEAARRGEESWFRLGDRDLMTHVIRTAALSRGETLTEATRTLCGSLGVKRRVLPMSDQPRPTRVATQDGETLAFQHWLVRARGAPRVRAIELGDGARPTPQVLEALEAAELIVICPSNPFVSILPILSLEGVREAVHRTTTLAVSPIVNGAAVKGPLASMIPDLYGEAPSAEAVAKHYEDLLDGYAVHYGDGFEAPYPVLETNILIQSAEDRVRLAHELLQLARRRR